MISVGLVALVMLGVMGPGESSDGSSLPGFLAMAAIALAAILVLVGVLVGRGWRSAWWSRRAEVAEAVCGSFAFGALVVAVGFFRHLWEVTG